MKRESLVWVFIPLLLLTACQSNQRKDVVCEQYVHRYGVPLDQEDWEERGQDGQVVAIRKDGVTETRSYDGGVLHGDCCYSFPYQDTIQMKEIYNKGELNGEVWYYSNGLPKRQVNQRKPQSQVPRRLV